jgi:RNA polymerase sigma-70 factor (ECF subfamily)
MRSGHARARPSTIKVLPTTRDISDGELITKIAAKDQLAMRALFARHHVRVYRFVLRFIGDAAKAEDVTSEVFFDVWNAADRFEGRSKVLTWILAIARFKSLSMCRERRHEDLDEFANTLVDQTDDPELALRKKDQSSLLRACLERLPVKHREIIDLVYYHEMSVSDVAEIVRVPPNTVKTRMFYARKRLAELLSQVDGQALRL